MLRSIVITLVSALWLSAGLQAQINTALTPTPKQQFFDNNGVPLPGGLLYTYAAGTTTPQVTYTDSTGNVANQNPVVLDSAGRAAVWLGGTPYKVVLKDASNNTIWTIDNVTDYGLLLQNNLAKSTGSGLIGYQPPGVGGQPETVQAKLSQTINVMDFQTTAGIGCSGPSHDDYAAISAAVSYAQSQGAISNPGARVMLPPGYCWSSHSIDLPANVFLEGPNTISSGIFALPGGSFSTYQDSSGTARTYLLSIGGNGSPSAIEGSHFSNFNVFGNGLVDTTIYTQSAEENSGAFNMYLTGYKRYGVDAVGYFTQNSTWDHLTCYAQSTATGGNCIHMFEANSRNAVSHITANGDFAGVIPTAAILFEAGSIGSASDIHCEGYATCVQVQDSTVNVSDVALTDSFATTALLIKGSSAVSARNIVKYGGSYASQITICDTTKIGTATCGGVSTAVMPNEIIETAYDSEWNSSGGVNGLGNYYGTNQYIFSNFHFLQTNFFEVPNIVDITNYSTGILTFRQLNNNFSGFNFQSSQLTTPGSTGGGAFIGSSYQNDPSAASFGGGCSTDSGTWVARATSCSGVGNIGGMSYFYANTGLTPGSQFTPYFPFSVTPGGIAIKPSSTNPGCVTGVTEGRIWLNSNYSPYRVEICDAGTWFYIPSLTVGP